MTSKKSATLENINFSATEKDQVDSTLLSRRLSLGDKPISESKNLTLEENFFLGRAGADPPQQFDHAEQNGKSDCRHRICITEVAPSHSSIVGANRDNDGWQMPIDKFTSKKKGKNSRRGMPKRVRAFYEAQDELIERYEEMLLDVDDAMENGEDTLKAFYKAQDELIDTYEEMLLDIDDAMENGEDAFKAFYKAQDELIETYEEMLLDVDDAMENAEDALKLQRTASVLSKLTLAANVVLLAAKLVASILSGSIAIISSLVDSFVDLASGIVITVATQAMARRNPYEYPQGRTKLEPISIVILSVIMSLASLQLIRESVEKIVSLADGTASIPDVTVPTIVITVSAIVIKLVLFLVSRRVSSPSVQALAMDHRNDVISNTFALIFGYIGSQDMQNKTGVPALVYLDPVGAILISIYIAINWYMTGYDQIKNLTGHTAKPDFLKKLTWLAVNHHPKLQYVDTVRAFHFGTNFLVEVDIVLPEDMTLKEAHDIGEPLQQKLERLPEVERAFVHLDYEFEHRPFDEHKQV